ncbi:MAG: tetratricopeptide repeat protein [bacterium]
MAKSSKKTETPEVVDDVQLPEDLYEREVDRYRIHLKRDLESTFRRYGFTLIHSLEPLEQVEVLKAYGFESADAADIYNLAHLRVRDEAWAEAADLFKQALKEKTDLVEASYNLALCYEKLGQPTQAVHQWEATLKMLPEGAEEDRTAIGEHLAELKK